MAELTVQLRTLTPLWTGGVDGTMDRIHETGILGSLRWWFEAIVRGLGGSACDPTKHEHELSGQRLKRYEQARREGKDWWTALDEAGICDACKVFGTTGWRRRFRMEVVDETFEDTSSPKKISANRPINPKTKRPPTWWLPGYPRVGNLTVRIQSFSQNFHPEIITGLIQFIANWAALGAKTQMGFGVVELVDSKVDTQSLFEWLKKSITGSNTWSDLPSLRNIFWARISPKNKKQFNDQETFNLKYDLRRLFASDKDLRHFIMGTTEDSRIATKVKISRPYNNGQEIRLWGWIPEDAEVYKENWNREKIVNMIYEHLKKHYTLQIWREMNSSRDTAKSNNSDIWLFLSCLLGLKEKSNEA